jgi:hypothetical protein
MPSIGDLGCSDVNIEQVFHYKYLGSIVNSDNTIEQEIKERLAIGNKAYAAHSSLFKSKLISKTANLRLYQMAIRPTVTYACETWTLKEAIDFLKINIYLFCVVFYGLSFGTELSHCINWMDVFHIRVLNIP